MTQLHAADILDADDCVTALPKRERAALLARIEMLAPEMITLAQGMWETPELGYQETEASSAMCSLLAQHGFAVTSGVAGLPTAFLAQRITGNGGPTVGFLAEMDALPGFSQDSSPFPSPIPGQRTGHACGHHLFGAGSIGAGIALADWLNEQGIGAEVRVYGTPAEEGGAGKAYMARAGLFAGLDLALHWHPDDCNNVWQSRSLASIGGSFRFHGRTSHAALAPEHGRSALHGVEAFHHMANLLRELVPPHTHIHYIVRQGGIATNVIPDYAESQVNVRHPEPMVALDVFDRLVRAAEGAAHGTETRMDFSRTGGVRSILPNEMVGRVMLANMQALEPITWTTEETAYALEMQKSMDGAADLTGVSKLDPYEFNKIGAFSSDVGDVSWLAPCGGLGTVTWVPGTRPHTWQAVAAGGTSIGWKGMVQAARGLATTAATFLSTPSLLLQARKELETARGADFVYRPLIGDGPAPLDYAFRNGAG